MLDSIGQFIDDIDPGAWPEWIGAVGTTLAFLIAAFAYRKSVKDGRLAQARLVYSKSKFEVVSEGTTFNGFRGAAYGKTLGLWPTGTPNGGDQVTMMECVVVTVSVHNASKGLISNAEVEVLTLSEYAFPERYIYNFDVVDPESTRSTFVAFPMPTEFSWNDLLTRVTFTDSAGSHWTRRFAGPVKRLRKDERKWPIPGPTLISDRTSVTHPDAEGVHK